MRNFRLDGELLHLPAVVFSIRADIRIRPGEVHEMTMHQMAWIGTKGDEVVRVQFQLWISVVGDDVMDFQLLRAPARDTRRLFFKVLLAYSRPFPRPTEEIQLFA